MTGERLDTVPDDIAAIAAGPHAVNFLTTELSWVMAGEAAALERREKGVKVTASDIVRDAIHLYFEQHPKGDVIRKLAITKLRQTQELEVLRAELKD